MKCNGCQYGRIWGYHSSNNGIFQSFQSFITLFHSNIFDICVKTTSFWDQGRNVFDKMVQFGDERCYAVLAFLDMMDNSYDSALMHLHRVSLVLSFLVHFHFN